jgi:hypothetical protein
MKLVSITPKFAAKISSYIGLVCKNTTGWPYAATESQIRRQQYGAKYSDLLFKTAKCLTKYEDWQTRALELGCKFE